MAMANSKAFTRITDSIRDPKRPIDHTVLFEWNPNSDPCPFSKFKLSGPHKGKKRLEYMGDGIWRADFVSSDSVKKAIEDGIDILSVRTERSAIVSNGYFKLSHSVMKEIQDTTKWVNEGDCYKCIGTYQDEVLGSIKEAEFIVYTKPNRKRCLAEVRVCARENGLNLNIFDESTHIRDNFLYWIRYGNKSKDGSVIERYTHNGFTDNTAITFVPDH